MTSDQLILAAIPTAAVLIGILRNESAIASLRSDNQSLREELREVRTEMRELGARLDARIERLEARIDQLDHHIQDWARIIMKHNSDIARLKDKVGLSTTD